MAGKIDIWRWDEPTSVSELTLTNVDATTFNGNCCLITDGNSSDNNPHHFFYGLTIEGGKLKIDPPIVIDGAVLFQKG